METTLVESSSALPVEDRLHLAVAAYLARYRDPTRKHAACDLRSYIRWCHERGLDPLAAQRRHVELFVRWMQEHAGYKPATVSRRLSVVIGFYRVCVIDRVLE